MVQRSPDNASLLHTRAPPPPSVCCLSWFNPPAAQIATIVPSPSVEASSKEIYMKTTPRLVVNGTNFNLKNTELYFDPPLQEGTVIQKQVGRREP